MTLVAERAAKEVDGLGNGLNSLNDMQRDGPGAINGHIQLCEVEAIDGGVAVRVECSAQSALNQDNMPPVSGILVRTSTLKEEALEAFRVNGESMLRC